MQAHSMARFVAFAFLFLLFETSCRAAGFTPSFFSSRKVHNDNNIRLPNNDGTAFIELLKSQKSSSPSSSSSSVTQKTTTKSYFSSSSSALQLIPHGGDGGLHLDGHQKKNMSTKTKLIAFSVTFATLSLGIWKRQSIASTLHHIKNEWLLTSLDNLNAAGTQGLVVYTILFFLWEMTAGLTTPVETAAGVAFGVKNGIIASAIGKLGGALTTFLLGRYIFYDKVHSKLKDNELLKLIESSIAETPMRVALLTRFSPLPEFVKNCGMAVLPLKLPYFTASIILHGFTFTCLWTYVGAETAKVMRGAAPSSSLKALATGVTLLEFVSPTLIGLWVKSLRDKQLKLRKQEEEGKGKRKK
mmetsp:Transcript_399/g.548  ORF Transcript_399/g.548 Transcript_399/m.548 type:complete len:357 (-) Transcript_399:168-1238(-)